MVGIYKITNPKGRIYIGQSVNIEQRKQNYKNFKTNKNNIGPKIFNSLKKYGWEQHVFEIIEECILELLNEREIYWGNQYNSLIEGLNCKLGESKGIFNEETKQKMSKAQLGNKKRLGCKMSDEAKQLIGEKNSRPKPKNFMNDDLRQKIGEGNKGISRNKNNKYRSKPITQYSLLGEELNTFSSALEAERYFNKSGSSISDCARGRQKTAYGFIWKYL